MRPARLLAVVMLATFVFGCGSGAATIPPDWLAISETVAPLPMAIAIPPGWKGTSFKLGYVLYAEDASTGTIMGVAEDPAGSADLGTYANFLHTFCTGNALPSATCVQPTLVHLPAGDAMRDPSNILGRGSVLKFVFPAKNQAGVTILAFISTTATSIPDTWDQIARTFNPYAAALPGSSAPVTTSP